MDATFKRLHVNLERGSEHNTQVDDIQAALDRNFEHLLDPLAVSPPNSVSRDRINTAVELEWRGAKHALDKNMRDFILSISDLLLLDEFDSFILFLNLLQYELKDHTSLSRTGASNLPPHASSSLHPLSSFSSSSSSSSSHSSSHSSSASQSWRQSTLLEIFDYFFEEKLCLLLCLGSLFRIADDPDEPFNAVALSFLSRLLQAGLVANLLRALFPDALPPAHLPPKLREKWARYQLELQEALLKTLFIAHYNRVPCTDASLLLLLRLFPAKHFGQSPPTLGLLDDSSRETLQRIGHLCVLILLACLNLEAYALASPSLRFGSQTTRDATMHLVHLANVSSSSFNSSSSSSSSSSTTTTTTTNSSLSSSNSSNSSFLRPQLGPIFLAWAALLDFYQSAEQSDALFSPSSSTPNTNNNNNNNNNITPHRQSLTPLPGAGQFEAEKRYLGELALRHGAFSYLQSMFAGGLFEGEPNFIGFQYVVYGLLTALLAAFPRMVEQQELAVLYREVFQNNVFTSACFWEKDLQDADRQRLFVQTRLRFPYDLVPYVELMAALANDSNGAHRVHQLLLSSSTFASQYSMSVAASELPAARGHVQLSRPCAVPISPAYPAEVASFQLDPGTLGMKMAIVGEQQHRQQQQHPEGDPKRCFVVWSVQYSCFDIFYAVIDAFLTQTKQGASRPVHFQQISSIFSLYVKLVPHFTDPELLTDAQRLDFAQLSRMLLPRLFDVLQTTMAFAVSPRYSPSDVPPLTVCDTLRLSIECIELFARHNPKLIWKFMRTRQILDGFRQHRHPNSSSAGFSQIRTVLSALESPLGRYPVTLAFLNLIRALLTYVCSWKTPKLPAEQDFSAAQPSFLADDTMSASTVSSSGLMDDPNDVIDLKDSLEPAFVYLRTDILNCFARGKFAKISERWKMGSILLEIIDSILEDSKMLNTASDSQGSSLRSIIFESSFHHVLISTIATGHQSLERWRIRRFKQAQLLENLLYQGLCVVERVLLLSSTAQDDFGQGRLRQTIFNRTIGKENNRLILVIASYIFYAHSPLIPLVATRILTLLCQPPKRTVIGLPSSSAPTAATTTPAASATTSATAEQPAARPISLIGYLGMNEERLRVAFLQRLAKSTEFMPLRIAILNFLVVCLESQPGLADMFLNLPKSTEERSKRAADGSSCLDVVVAILTKKNHHHIDRSPQLFCSALTFLLTLWKFAIRHQPTIKYLKAIPGFWEHLVLPLIEGVSSGRVFHDSAAATLSASATHPASSVALEVPNLDNELTIPSVGAIPECFRIMSRALILKILTLEILYMQGVGQPLTEPFQEQLSSIQSSQVLWMRSFSRVHFNPEVVKRLGQISDRLALPLQDALTQDRNPTFGVCYVYDLQMLMQKLYHIRDKPIYRELTEAVQTVNTMFSLADAELQLLHSWCRFVQTTAYTGIVKYFPQSQTQLGTDPALQLIKGLVNYLQMETREAFLVLKKLYEIADLLEAMMHLRFAHCAMTDAIFPVEYMFSAITSTVQRINAHIHLLIATPDASKLEALEALPSQAKAHPSLELLLAIQKCLLTCVFSLLKFVDNYTNLSPLCVKLLPELHATFLQPSLVDITLAILQRMVQFHLTSSRASVGPSSYLSVFTGQNLCTHIIEYLSTAFDTLRHPSTLFNAAHFLLCLSQDANTAESLVVSGYMMLLGTRSLNLFAASEEAYDVSQGDRNAWHQIWCILLRSVSSLVRQLGYTSNFIDQAFRFVLTHHDRLLRVLTLPPILTLGRLEEMQAVTELFLVLRCAAHSWTTALGRLSVLQQNTMLHLFAQGTTLLRNFDQLYSSCSAITIQEKGAVKQLIAHQHVDTSPPRRRRRGRPAPEMQFQEHLLFRQIEEMLLSCLLNTASFLRLLSPNPCAFVDDQLRESLDPELQKPIFSALVDSVTEEDGFFPIGLLLAFLDWALLRLKQLQPASQDASPATETGSDQLIVQLIDHCLLIVIGHMGHYLWASPPTRQERRIIVNKFTSLEGIIQKLIRDQPRCQEIAQLVTAFLERWKNHPDQHQSAPANTRPPPSPYPSTPSASFSHFSSPPPSYFSPMSTFSSPLPTLFSPLR